MSGYPPFRTRLAGNFRLAPEVTQVGFEDVLFTRVVDVGVFHRAAALGPRCNVGAPTNCCERVTVAVVGVRGRAVALARGEPSAA